MKPKFQTPVVKGNHWCCPTSISILTGIPTGQAAALIRKHSGQRLVKAASLLHTASALRDCGLNTFQVPNAMLGNLDPKKHYLVSYRTDRSWHAAVVHGGQIRCSLQPNGGRIPIAMPRRVIEVTAGTGKPPKPSIKKRPKTDPSKQMVKKLAAAHNIEIIRDNPDSSIWVYPPDGFPIDSDPYDDGHCHCDWTEALEAVKAYILLLTQRQGQVGSSHPSATTQGTASPASVETPSPGPSV